jgi:hypothetical protein
LPSAIGHHLRKYATAKTNIEKFSNTKGMRHTPHELILLCEASSQLYSGGSG